jgi:hypothetical protein
MPEHSQILPIEIALSAIGVNVEDIQYRHYGLFGNSDEGNADLLTAQARFSQFITDAIVQSTDAADEVLLIGVSLKPVADSLKLAELTPAFIESGKDLTCDIPTNFAAMVLEGSFHYLDQLPLLRLAKNYLQEGGTLILFGEFLCDDSCIKPANIPNLSSLNQLSQRLGFGLKVETEFTQDAIQSLEVLGLQLMQAERQTGSDTLGTTIESIKAEFISGRRCFSVFQFIFSPERITEFPKAEFMANEEFGGQEISQLFESSFGHAFDVELWRWKYILGKGKSIVVKEHKDGEIVSHYGGAPRDIHFFGKLNKAIQVCDVMVAPRLRKYYGKSSLFFKSAATFLEREIGNTVGHLLGFGFPNQKAMNIAIRLGLYEKTDDFVELVFSAAPKSESLETHLVDIDPENQLHKDAIDALWQEMQAQCANYIVGVRNWEYFYYRYFQHPAGMRGEYRRFLLMDTKANKVLAAMVCKTHGTDTLLMDLVCAPSTVARRLDQLLSCGSSSEITGSLKMWITKAWVSRLQFSGAIENNLGIEIPCNSWNPGPSAKSLYGKWWLTAGDMDFL